MYKIGIDFNGDAQISFFGDNLETRRVREFKGKSENKHVNDYCVVDLETTGVFVNSSEIIEISALKVKNNRVIDEYTTLINPNCHIPKEATEINNITDDMVKDAPYLRDIIDSFLYFIGDSVIVGYNIASFDMNLIYDSVMELRSIPFSNNYIDLLHAARRSIKGLENYKLETISRYYGFNTIGEHRALKDCYLTKSCYDRLFEEYGDTAFISQHGSSTSKGVAYSTETLAIKELHTILERFLEDGNITIGEIEYLRYWIEEHRDLSGHYPFDRAFNALDGVLEDGRITSEELVDLKTVFTEIIDPVRSISCHDLDFSLTKKHVCLTGEFDFGSRSSVERLIIAAGGIIDKAVKKTTGFLVVGAQGSDAWKTGNYGGKIQKAIEYNSKGSDIKIFEEKEFIARVKHLASNPEITNESAINSSEGMVVADWKTTIQSILNEIEKDYDLPKESLFLRANYNRERSEITSYSVCIYEAEFPASKNMPKEPDRNTIILNIKEMKERLDLLINNEIYNNVDKPEAAEIKHLQSDAINTHVRILKDSCSLITYLKNVVEYELVNYTPRADAFACCSKFLLCSDSKRCVHENKLYSKACIYRHNLELGRIYYGKNKNVF